MATDFATSSASEVRVITATAAVPAAFAYNVARKVELLPKWAAGLAAGVRQEGGHWYADSPMGRVRVEMAPENTSGILDHDVTLPDGTTVHNAFRVVPVDDASCIFTFVVVRQPGTTRDAFEADVVQVERDLLALQELLESEAEKIELANGAVAGLEDMVAGRVSQAQGHPAVDMSRRWHDIRDASVEAVCPRGGLVTVPEFAAIDGRTVADVEADLAAGRLLGVVVNGEPLVLEALADPRIDRRQLARVSRVLESISPGARIIFLTTGKASLGGITPFAALAAGQFAATLRAARGFAER